SIRRKRWWSLWLRSKYEIQRWCSLAVFAQQSRNDRPSSERSSSQGLQRNVRALPVSIFDIHPTHTRRLISAHSINGSLLTSLPWCPFRLVLLDRSRDP